MVAVFYIIVSFASIVYGGDPIERISGSYKYELFTNGEVFGAANSTCEARNAWLVEIKDNNISDALTSLMPTSHDFMIGAKFEDVWKWMDGSPMIYTNWKNDVAPPQSGCLMMDATTLKWKADGCTNVQRYICQSDISYRGWSFEITNFTSKIDYDAADTFCSNIGSSLVDIKESSLDSYISGILSIDSWAGGKYDGESWKWTDGTSIDNDDARWGNNQPSSNTNQYCLLKTRGNGWKSELCRSKAGYICQKYLDPGTCSDKVCSNRGKCSIVGNRYNCTCNSGYFGTKCEKDLIAIGSINNAFVVNKGDSLSVTLTIVSYVGDVYVKDIEKHKDLIATSKITSSRLTEITTVTLGPFVSQNPQATYNIGAISKNDNKIKSKNLEITVDVKDHCTSNPCANKAVCNYATNLPYYTCYCTPAFNGTKCGELIVRRKGICKYHVNHDQSKQFNEAKSICQSIGGSLAMLKSSEIHSLVIEQIVMQYGADDTVAFWIGGTNRDNSWYWLDDTSIPLTESDAQWALSAKYPQKNITNEYLLLGSYGNKTQNTLKWFSESGNLKHGYVCEIQETDPCNSLRCVNGTCIAVGCQANCHCEPGYTGGNCSKEIFTITAMTQNFISMLGQNITVNLTILGYNGSVRIDVFENVIGLPALSTITATRETAEIVIGPFANQSFGTKYWFRATPQLDPDSYYKNASIDVVVQGPAKIQSITPKILAIPNEKSPAIICNATGVPLPSVQWFKDGKMVTNSSLENIYQIRYQGYAYLMVKNESRFNFGDYTCHSYNVVNGTKRISNDTAFLRGKIKFVSAHVTHDASMSSSLITCIYEGYPKPNILWRWLQRKRTSEFLSNQVFSNTSFVNTTSGFVNETSQLKIRLVEYLGTTKFACSASNIYENAKEVGIEINKNLVLSRNRAFRFFNFSKTKSYSDAQNYCTSIQHNLAKISDNETQNILATTAAKLHLTDKIYIGAQKSTEYGVGIWRWHDRTFLYNESQYIDGSYTAWLNNEPTHDGNCSAMTKNKNWKWTSANCSRVNNFVCEKIVSGTPMNFENKVDECSSNITINWTPAPESIGFTHRIDVAEINSNSTANSKLVFPKRKDEKHRWKIPELKPWTSYSITITVCPDICPYPSTTTKTVTTDAGIPELVKSANVTQINESCVIAWEMDSKPGITSFIINASSTIVKDKRGTYIGKTYGETREVSSATNRHLFEYRFNRNYTFNIQALTCAGAGPSLNVVGNCITRIGPPDQILSSTVASQSNIDDTININILIPDDINGPISCLFVVVVFMPNRSLEEKFATLEDLSRATTVNDSESLTENDAYIAIAISRSDISQETTGVRNFSKSLGDGTSSTCNLTQTKKSFRRKRQVSPTTTIRAINAKLQNGATYSYYTLSTTPADDGAVYFMTSNITYFTKVRYSSPTDNSSQTPSIAIVIVVIIVILGCIVTAFIWFKKKRARNQKQADVVSLTNMTARTAPEPEYANLAMDNPEEKSETDIPLSRLLEVYNSLRADASAKFYDQFQKLKQAAKTLDYPTQNASAESLRRKNRYKNILPSDHSRVILRGEGDYSYINACYISGYRKPKKYIATQGPLASTIVDFWRMIFEQKVQVIVMLAKCMENGKRKCEKYWPALGSLQQYGDITVINAEEISYGCFKLRTFGMIKNNEEFKVHQMQFVDWPDHGVPTTTTNLIRFCSSVAEQESNGPIVVHCSAGAGRTGTFIAYNFLLEKSEIRNSVDVYKCVLELRKQRVDMVQTCEQYMLVHKLILEHHLYGITDVDPTIIKNMRDSSRDRNIMLKTQYENLSFIGPISQVKCGVGEKISAMNRNDNIVPYENNHVFISRLQNDTESPYLNASTIEAYGNASKMIAAQGPLKNTVEYFWRAVIDNNIKTVIMLTKCTEKKKEQCYRYWPEEKNTETKVGKITIKLRQEDDKETIIQREFFVKRKDVEMTVIQYQYTGWKSNECPRNASAVLEMIDKMQSSLQRDKDASVLVHCSDGAGRTGALCAIVNLIERLKAENKVDVFRAVKDLRDCRPGMVQTLDQYRFCFKAVSEYLTLYSVYDNVNADEDDGDQTDDNPYVTV